MALPGKRVLFDEKHISPETWPTHYHPDRMPWPDAEPAATRARQTPVGLAAVRDLRLRLEGALARRAAVQPTRATAAQLARARQLAQRLDGALQRQRAPRWRR